MYWIVAPETHSSLCGLMSLCFQLRSWKALPSLLYLAVSKALLPSPSSYMFIRLKLPQTPAKRWSVWELCRRTQKTSRSYLLEVICTRLLTCSPLKETPQLGEVEGEIPPGTVPGAAALTLYCHLCISGSGGDAGGSPGVSHWRRLLQVSPFWNSYLFSEEILNVQSAYFFDAARLLVGWAKGWESELLLFKMGKGTCPSVSRKPLWGLLFTCMSCGLRQRFPP